MTLPEVAAELRYGSPDALRMATRRGAIKLQPMQIPGRRELLFVTDHVAELIQQWEQSALNKGVPM